MYGPPSEVHPVVRRASAPPAALDLLAVAQAGLDEAAAKQEPHECYAEAHLAALRSAAAVLAARGRPETSERRRRRIRSVWEVLPEVEPELTEWSALFASGAERRARAEAGIRTAATWSEARALLADAEMFHRLVERMLVPQLALPLPKSTSAEPEPAGAGERPRESERPPAAVPPPAREGGPSQPQGARVSAALTTLPAQPARSRPPRVPGQGALPFPTGAPQPRPTGRWEPPEGVRAVG